MQVLSREVDKDEKYIHVIDNFLGEIKCEHSTSEICFVFLRSF